VAIVHEIVSITIKITAIKAAIGAGMLSGIAKGGVVLKMDVHQEKGTPSISYKFLVNFNIVQNSCKFHIKVSSLFTLNS
jgi:hypothetical protein